MRLRNRTAALTSLAGYGVHDPLMVGVQQDGTPGTEHRYCNAGQAGAAA